MLRAHRRTYARFWEWSQRVVDSGFLLGYLDSCSAGASTLREPLGRPACSTIPCRHTVPRCSA